MLTQTRLRELLGYDPLTGELQWRYSHRGRVAGALAGTICTFGYRVIRIDNELFRSARLVWLYMTGQWPDNDIDHVNGKPSDDRWENLRDATKSENMRNTKMRINNTSGARGVSWNKRLSKWHARVNVNKTLYHCGYFDSFEAAVLARDAKAKTLHGAFARLNSNPPLETIQ